MREAAELFAIGPEIAARARLAETADAAAVRDFVVTRSADRAWSAINQQLAAERGGLFWIGGPAGAGKTHFLNYVTALNARGGALGIASERVLTLAVNLAAESARDLPRTTAHMIAKELTSDQAAIAMWRGLGSAERLRVALDQAKRLGVAAITVALDFDQVEPEAGADGMKALATLAGAVARPRLTVIAAGRSRAPINEARVLEVMPAAHEFAAVAIGRARQLDPAVAHEIRGLYDEIASDDTAAAELFPFLPAAAQALVALGGSTETIVPAAQLARAVLLEARAAARGRTLIWPSDLAAFAEVRRVIQGRLSERSRAAREIATRTAAGMSEPRRARSMEVIELLALHQAAGSRRPLALAELGRQVRADVWGGLSEERRREQLTAAVDELTRFSNGAIAFDRQKEELRFDEAAAGAPEVAAFNDALGLTRRFDASLERVTELEEVQRAGESLRAAMAAALEQATRNREQLRAAARECAIFLSAEQEQTFENYIALTESGPPTLIAAAAQAERRAELRRTLDDYELLDVLAAAVPRLRGMREYLEAMGLHRELEDDPARDPAVAKLEAECKLLLMGVTAALHARTASGLDALEARFQRFKWTYVPYYRAAHEAWRRELEAATTLAEDAQRQLDVLERLNRIRALGAPQGPELAGELSRLARGVTRCGLEGALSPEIDPCCPFCNFVVGTPSARVPLTEFIARVRRALQGKLAALSQSAIARLIEQHDHARRLEGFLKITQAAQTDGLIAVLDEQLARYLGRLLDENLLAEAAPSRAVVQPLRMARSDAPSQRSHKRPSRGN
jgi:hypothetical protein